MRPRLAFRVVRLLRHKPLPVLLAQHLGEVAAGGGRGSRVSEVLPDVLSFPFQKRLTTNAVLQGRVVGEQRWFDAAIVQ